MFIDKCMPCGKVIPLRRIGSSLFVDWLLTFTLCFGSLVVALNPKLFIRNGIETLILQHCTQSTFSIALMI